MTLLDQLLVVVGALGLVVAALSEKMRSLPLSEPLLGLATGIVLGRHVTGVMDLEPLTSLHPEIHEASRVLLALSVMAVALRYPVAGARQRLRSVVILLLVAMPVMALVSGALSWLILGVPLAVAALIGTALAPTDPVLASSVVTGDLAERDLPERTRQLLSLESGANDGLALPLVLAAVAAAGSMTGVHALTESLWQVLGGAAAGAAVGWLGGRALRLGEAHGAVERGPALLFTLLLALAIMGLSGLIHVDGVLAVFVGGLVLNGLMTGRDRAAGLSVDEAVNRFAVLPLFVVLGATLPWGAWAELGWQAPTLAVAVLALRRLPVLLLLAKPMGLRWRDAAFLGWFGPVGVSALFYLTLEAKELRLDEEVIAAGSLIVAVSVLLHGITSAPGRRLYAAAATSTRVGSRSS